MSLREELGAAPLPEFTMTLPPGWSRSTPDDATLERMLHGLRARLMQAGRPDLQWSDAVDEPVRHAARQALTLRDEAPALAIFLVWPIVAPLPVVCHVSVMASSSLPRWAELDSVVHGFEAEGLGPGIQCTVRRAIDDGEGVSMHLVFDDGSTTLILSIDETLPALLVRALPGFLRLPSRVTMQTVDGVPFAPIPIPGVLEAEPWAVAVSGAPHA